MTYKIQSGTEIQLDTVNNGLKSRGSEMNTISKVSVVIQELTKI